MLTEEDRNKSGSVSEAQKDKRDNEAIMERQGRAADTRFSTSFRFCVKWWTTRHQTRCKLTVTIALLIFLPGTTAEGAS